MKILVTGGSGFLGSHVADALTEADHEVLIYDNRPSPYLRKGQKSLIGDILNEETLVEATKKVNIVFHLAAMANIDAAWNNPVETIRTNVIGTTNVLEACRINKVPRFIFASSLYADSTAGHLYGVSKSAGESLCKVYSRCCNIQHTILRFGTLYGTRSTEANSIHRLLKQALTGKIDYYGTGREIREYIHVRDAAQICTYIDQFKSETLIITGHNRIKLSDLLNMINEILDKKVEVNYHPKENKSHYEQTPYSYISTIPKRVVPNLSSDLGESLVEVLKEIDNDPKSKTDRP